MLTVVILAAGYGSRMGYFSGMINKALVPYNNQPLISHIFNKFNIPCKFIIACGHMGSQIKEYVSSVHADKLVQFVDILDYSEKTTGPASSLLQCAPYIDNNFFVITCDTLFDFDFDDKLNQNWIGVHPVDSDISQDYCWIKRNGNKIVYIKNKVKNETAVDAFIGLIYCKDKTYLDNLKDTRAKELYTGMLDNLNLQAYTVYNWQDFGTYDKWLKLNLHKNLSLTKPNEIFYHDNNKIVKFHIDSNVTNNKFLKSQLNKNCMPDNLTLANQFLIHDYVEGDILYNQIDPTLFKKLLDWAKNKLWNPIDQNNLKDLNHKFYYQKTLDRLTQFRIKNKNWNEPIQINDIQTNSIEHYLNKIDWEQIYSESSWSFIHGDFQFENIIYNKKLDKFTCIDWRSDFAGNLYGDIYYDFAKLAAGIYCNYQLVRTDKLFEESEDHQVVINLLPLKDSDLYSIALKSFIENLGYNWNKVQLLVPLIYLNMSPLHETPYDRYLFCLSKLYFSKLFK